MDVFGVALSGRDLWLLGGVGLLLAWLVPHRLSLTRDQLARRLAACTAIVDAFRPELLAIQQTDQDIGRFILTDAAFKKHSTAIITHRRHLSWMQRIRLYYAWKQLACPTRRDQGARSYFQYCDAGSLEKRRVIRPLAVASIQRIISILE
jgi:hypothetical protein